MAATASQPCKSSFRYPTFRQQHKARCADRPQYGLQDPTKSCLYPLGQTVATVSAVGPNDTKSTKSLSQSFQDQSSTIVVLDIGGMHDDGKNQAHRINDQMTFSSADLFAGIVATLSSAFRSFHALTIDDRRTRRRLASLGFSNLATQGIVDFLPCSVQTPDPKDAIGRAPLGQVMGYRTPGTAR